MADDPRRSLQARRAELVDDRSVTGSEWCRRYAAAADDWLTALFDDATAGDQSGVALIAVGGFGRGELAPASDLDLLLVHDRKARIGPIADAIWYPVWDTGVKLDHSVRSPRELRSAMDGDIKVAVGLLDARFVAGDYNLARKVLDNATEMWRTRASRWLPALDAETRDRHARFDDVAFLLEPDLKEARGGLRDLHLLMTLGRVVPILAGTLDDPRLADAGEVLTSARVELQRATGRNTNTLLLQEQDAIGAALGYHDADSLMAAVASAGLTLAWTNDDGWRRMASWLAGPAARGSRDRPIESGLVLRDDEVCIAAGCDVAGDPSLALRAAAVSAELDKPMARATLDRLGAEARAPDDTWPQQVLDAFVRLLGAGRPAVAAIESLDHLGVWLRYLPEWEPVRHRPQRNAYHRYTIDRHLWETTANAAGLTRRVARPDLLLLGALLHDIGKGRGGDHTEKGIEVVRDLCPRIGLDASDTAAIEALVRYHLLLPDVATRRDLDDPATAARVAKAVGDQGTLEILAALTEADSLATGPAAWGHWKAGLVERLVVEAMGVLEGRSPPDSRSAALRPDERELLGRGAIELIADGGRVTVAAPDEPGLLATVAGVLTLARVSVRSATTMSDADTRMALLRFQVAPAFERLPDWRQVQDELRAAIGGRVSLQTLLEERDRHYARYRRASQAAPPVVGVTLDNDSSPGSTIVEVRALDRGPVLYQVAKALTDSGVTITCALVNTLGAEAIDVFYVNRLGGGQVTDPQEQAELRSAVSAAL